MSIDRLHREMYEGKRWLKCHNEAFIPALRDAVTQVMSSGKRLEN